MTDLFAHLQQMRLSMSYRGQGAAFEDSITGKHDGRLPRGPLTGCAWQGGTQTAWTRRSPCASADASGPQTVWAAASPLQTPLGEGDARKLLLSASPTEQSTWSPQAAAHVGHVAFGGRPLNSTKPVPIIPHGRWRDSSPLNWQDTKVSPHGPGAHHSSHSLLSTLAVLDILHTACHPSSERVVRRSWKYKHFKASKLQC